MSETPAPETLEHLRGVALFRGLTPAELAAVAQAAGRRRVARGEYFFQQDDPAQRLYVLYAGRVKLQQLTPEGHQVVLRVLSPGELFGVMAIGADSVYPGSTEALEDSEALAWDAATLEALMERIPRLALNALKQATARAKEFQDRYRELATERVERRVARALLRLARQTGRKDAEGAVLIDMPLTRQDLAEMTGTTLYTVSRILSRWEQQGLVASGRERVRILFPHGLVTIAEDLPTPGVNSDSVP